jgi:hypothetical protein
VSVTARPSPTLGELQAAFARAIDGDVAAAAALVQDGAPAPEERLGIYANNVAATFRQALELSFPAVRRLVGAEWFASAAGAYRRAHPSRSGDLQPAGAGFPDFLAARLADTPHAVVADVARLEWAREEAAIAPAVPPFDATVLAAVPAERHGELAFTLHPSVRLVASPFPLHEIWAANVASDDPPPIDLALGPQALLVHRLGLEVRVAVIDRASHAFAQALLDGATLAAAAERAHAIAPDFPLEACLADLAVRAVLAAVRVEAAPG